MIATPRLGRAKKICRTAFVLSLFAAAVRDGGAAGVMVTHSAASAAVADRVLKLGADGLAEQRGS